MLKKFYVCPVCNKPIMQQEYVVCPNCGKPITQKKDIQECINQGTKYCKNCGKEIASTLVEALAEKD